MEAIHYTPESHYTESSFLAEVLAPTTSACQVVPSPSQQFHFAFPPVSYQGEYQPQTPHQSPLKPNQASPYHQHSPPTTLQLSPTFHHHSNSSPEQYIPQYTTQQNTSPHQLSPQQFFAEQQFQNNIYNQQYHSYQHSPTFNNFNHSPTYQPQYYPQQTFQQLLDPPTPRRPIQNPSPPRQQPLNYDIAQGYAYHPNNKLKTSANLLPPSVPVASRKRKVSDPVLPPQNMDIPDINETKVSAGKRTSNSGSDSASKKKKKKSSNEPEKPGSAYALFFRDMQGQVKQDNPDSTFGEISKLVANLWENLDSDAKCVYKKRQETARKSYLKELASYRATKVSRESSSGSSSASGSASSGSDADSSPVTKDAPVSLSDPATTASSNFYGSGVARPAAAYSRQDASGAIPRRNIFEAVRATPPPKTAVPQYLTSSRSGTTVAMNHTVGHVPTPLPAAPGLICRRDGCGRPAVEHPRWDGEYCSGECVVAHCKTSFTEWVQAKKMASAAN